MWFRRRVGREPFLLFFDVVGRRSARRGFKNRKPIGEVGCCESRMAERKESAKRKKSAERSGKYFSTPET